MRTAAERRNMLERLLERVRKNRAEMEQARLAGPAVEPVPAEPEPIEPEPEPVALEPIEPVAPPEPSAEVAEVVPEPVEPEPVEPEPLEPEPLEPELVEPEPVEPEAEAQAEPEPVVEVVAAPAEPEERAFEATVEASGPVATTAGGQEKQWTIEAVLDRAWKLGSPG